MNNSTGSIHTRDMGESPFALQLTDVRMTLAHRVLPQRGCLPVLARHWFRGSVAVSSSRMLISSAGLVVMELSVPSPSSHEHLSIELPTPACLELMIDADYCTRQLHGHWELRLYTGEAERLARYLGRLPETA